MSYHLSSGETISEINEDLVLIEKDSGIKFGTDSYLISAFIRKNISGDAADLGAGSGVISLFAAARCSFDAVHAIEIQREFSELITRNARQNSLDGKIVTHCEDIRNVKDVFRPETFAAVFSNPPYMKVGSGKAPSASEMNKARREENGTVDDFCAAASYLLKYGGLFWTVFRPERIGELISSLTRYSLEPKRMIFVHSDVTSPPSLVLTEAKKGAAPGVRIARPLIIYNDPPEEKTRRYTKDMERVYSDFSLEFLFDK